MKFLLLGGKITEKKMVQFMKEIKKMGEISEEEAAQLAASKIVETQPKSQLYYKIVASRAMAGGKKVDPRAKMNKKMKGFYGALIEGKKVPVNDATTEHFKLIGLTIPKHRHS